MIDRIAITTCEIDEDLQTALRIGTEWGIRNFEFRSVWEKRPPRLTDDESAKLVALVKEFGVNIVALSPSVFRDGHSDEEVAESLDLLEKTFDLAESLDCRQVITFAFRRDDAVSPDLVPRGVVDTLRDAARRAEDRGMRLVHESLRKRNANTSARALELVEAVDHPCFGLNWDAGNMRQAGDTTVFPEGYNLLKPYIRHVHLKNWTPGDNWTTLDRGVLNWTDMLAALKRDGYDGYLTIETHHGPLAEKSRINHDWLKKAVQDW